MLSNVAIIIPARLASSRLPNKPVIRIGHRLMIEWVYLQCTKAGIGDVFVATPDQIILDLDVNPIVTSNIHPTGSDRVAEAAEKLKGKYRYIMNVQGDIPFVSPELIRMIWRQRYKSQADIVTAAAPINMVTIDQGYAWRLNSHARQHIGIYAFTAESLSRFGSLPQSDGELSHNLELRRAYDNGMSVDVIDVAYGPLEVNAPRDVSLLLDMLLL